MSSPIPPKRLRVDACAASSPRSDVAGVPIDRLPAQLALDSMHAHYAAAAERHPAPALPLPAPAATPPAGRLRSCRQTPEGLCSSAAAASSAPGARRNVQFDKQLCAVKLLYRAERDDPPCAVPSSTAVPAKPALRKRVRSAVTAAPDDTDAKRAKPTPAAAATLPAATSSDAEERLIAAQLRLDDAQQAESRAFFIPRARDHDSCLAYVMANAAALRALLEAEEEHAAASEAAEKEIDTQRQQASAAAAAAAPLPHELQEDDPYVRALIQRRRDAAAKKRAARSTRRPPLDFDYCSSFDYYHSPYGSAAAAAPPLPVGPTPLDAAVERWRLAQLHVVRTAHVKHLAQLIVNETKLAIAAACCCCHDGAPAAAAAGPSACNCRENAYVRAADIDYQDAWIEHRDAERAALVAHSETTQLAADPSAAESATATSSPLCPAEEEDDLFSLSLHMSSSDDEGDAATAEAHISDDELSLRLHSSDDESEASISPAAAAAANHNSNVPSARDF